LIFFLLQNNFIEKIDISDNEKDKENDEDNKIIIKNENENENENINEKKNVIQSNPKYKANERYIDIEIEKKNQIKNKNFEESKNNFININPKEPNINRKDIDKYMKKIEDEEKDLPIKFSRAVYIIIDVYFSNWLINLILYLINEEEFNFFQLIIYYFCYSIINVKVKKIK
jgi:hypothetical protein